MSKPTSRLIRLLRMLHQLNQEQVNIHGLQVEYEISERAAQRDLQTLRLAGFDIDPVRPGVYQLTGAMRFINSEGTYGEKHKN